MNRILNLIDGMRDGRDCAEATSRGAGIASRFDNHEINMVNFKMEGSFGHGGSYLDLYIGYKDRRGNLSWSDWNVGCQSKLTVWFEDGTVKDFRKSDYKTENGYKKAVYDFFTAYINNGFNLTPKFEIATEVEFLDI